MDRDNDPRMAARVRRWAHRAAELAEDPGTNTGLWDTCAARLYAVADLYDMGDVKLADTRLDGMVADLMRAAS